jgi:hypothetical protein
MSEYFFKNDISKDMALLNELILNCSRHGELIMTEYLRTVHSAR